MGRILILGAGGNSVDILDVINEINEAGEKYECLGFLDDNERVLGREIMGVRVVGALGEAGKYEGVAFVCGIGSVGNFWRRDEIVHRTGIADKMFETIVHPKASVSRSAKIGRGSVIFQNVSVTSNVKIGKHVLVLPNAIVSHDSEIGDYTCVTGGVCISGKVKIGGLCYLGTNSTIRDRIEIGEKSLIGMGSNVLASVPMGSVMVGNPARFLRKIVD
jgi:sugar O-acyltransferase (sialic acid O-acetyltransferase NeuD family)